MFRLEDLLKTWPWFFQPLLQALNDDESLREFLAHFGYDPQQSVLVNVYQELGDALRPALAQPDPTAPSSDAARGLFSSLESIAQSPAVRNLVTDARTFMEELFNFLLYRYLSTQHLPVAAALRALGVISTTRVRAADSGGRDIDYDRLDMHWARLGDFVRDNARWAKEVYGWGATPAEDGRVFDYNLAIRNLAHLVESTQLGLSRTRKLPADEASVFLANVNEASVEEVQIPLFQADLYTIDASGSPVFQREIGLKVVPSGDLARPETMGLAIAPYAAGTVAQSIPLSESVALNWVTLVGAAGGAYLRISPGAMAVLFGGGAGAIFEFCLTYGNPDGTPTILLGEPGHSRVEVASLHVATGGSLDTENADLYCAVGVDQLSAVIDVKDDGFLGFLLNQPIPVDAGSIVIGWRTGRGVYFEGGTSLGVTVPLNWQLGPVRVVELAAQLSWEEDVAVTVTVTGEAQLGPVYAYLEQVGLVASLVPAEQGLFGEYDVTFGFKPPAGYALELGASPLQGGGAVAIYEHEYRGALALRFGDFGLAAFAILNTQLPGGREGFSLVASLFGEFVLPLGYGFFLTGVGGIIGVNRTTDTDALRTVLFEGRFDNLLFPRDPIANAASILDDLSTVFPPQEGQYLFGPIARISFSQPPLVEGKLGVVLEVGRSARLLILGGLSSDLPTKDAALISLRFSFFGEVDFAAGALSFDASLANSRVLDWPVSGDAAVRSGWGATVEHVASFGGLHPRYPRPATLPDLHPLSIAFGTNNPRVTLSAYAALTLTSLQFGARADLYATGPDIDFIGAVAAEGWASFDALISFHPFGFDVTLGGGLQLLIDGEVIAALGFDLRLTGPNTFHLTGRVWVTTLGIEVAFPIEHRWGRRQALPTATADPLAALRRAIEGTARFEPLPAHERVDAVVFSDEDPAVDPAGGARWIQHALPLAVRIEKIGEARIAGAVDRLDVAVFAVGGTPVAVHDAANDFVRGHFWATSDAEKLRAPAFEQHKAGFDLATGGLLADPDHAVTAVYDYEVLRVPAPGDRQPADAVPHEALDDVLLARWMRIHHAEVAEPAEKFRDWRRPPDPVTLREPAFVPGRLIIGAAPAALTPEGMTAALHQAFGATEMSLTDARDRLAAPPDPGMGKPATANPVVADYVAANATM